MAGAQVVDPHHRAAAPEVGQAVRQLAVVLHLLVLGDLDEQPVERARAA